MCPFLSEEDYDFDNEIDGCVVEPKEINQYHRLIDANFLKDDRKFFILGGAAAFFIFFIITYVMYFNSKPIDIEDLPLIQADATPFKIKPDVNNQVNHQDKIVYDNISGDKRVVKNEKIAPSPEEIMSLPEADSDTEVEDLPNSSMQRIDAEAPKETQLKTVNNVSQVDNLLIIENLDPPIKKVEINTSKQHKKIKDLIDAPKIVKDQKIKSHSETKIKTAHSVFNGDKLAKSAKLPRELTGKKGNVMIQMAIVKTKAAAEAEYKRIVNKNKFLKSVGKKISKVDLGKKRGIRYKIQAGPYRTIAEAKKAVKMMQDNGFPVYVAKKL